MAGQRESSLVVRIARGKLGELANALDSGLDAFLLNLVEQRTDCMPCQLLSCLSY